MSSGAPIRDALGVFDAALKAVGAEGSEHDGGGAIGAADGPPRDGHV
jgi:hypothetical protein